MADEYSACDLVICRAGATTCAELTAAGRNLEALFTQVTARDVADDAMDSGGDPGPDHAADGRNGT